MPRVDGQTVQFLHVRYPATLKNNPVHGPPVLLNLFVRRHIYAPARWNRLPDDSAIQGQNV